MKNLLFSVCALLLINFSAQSQEFRKFKVDVLMGYASPSTSGSKGGLAVSIEPKYNLNDNLALGLKIEVAALSVVANATTNVTSARSVSSTLLTAENYFGDSNTRPFIGIGAGLFYTGSVSITSGNQASTLDAASKFGFAPRAGLQMGHFRLVGEYNLVKDDNYFSIKLGATIGGGRK